MDSKYMDMVLQHEVEKCRGHIGAEMLNAISEEDLERFRKLNVILILLDTVISLLKNEVNEE